MHKNNFSFLIFLLFSFYTFAQNPAKIDSLKEVLHTKTSNKTRVEVFVNLAKEYQYSDSTQFLVYSQKAIQLAKKIKDHKAIAKINRDIGNFYLHLSQFETSLSFFEKSLELSQKKQFQKLVIDAYNGIGNVYDFQGKYPEALKFYTKALKNSEKIEYWQGMANGNGNIGLIYYFQGKYVKSLEFYHKSLKISKKNGDKRGMSNSYNNIGLIHENQEEFDLSLKYYHKVTKIAKSIENKQVLAYNYNNIGGIYTKKKKYDKALEFHDKSIKLAEKIGDVYLISYNYHHIGYAYFEQKKYIQAIDFYQKALQLQKQINDSNGIGTSYIFLGKAYLKLQDYRKAEEYLRKGFQLSQELGNPSLIEDASLSLSKLYAKTKNYQKAYEYQLMFKDLSDSLFNKKNIKKLARLEEKYLFEKKADSIKVAEAQKNKLLDVELKQRRFTQYVSWIGLIILSILVFIIFRFLQVKRKSNKLLQAQAQELQVAHQEVQVRNEEIQAVNETLNLTLNTVQQQKDEILGSIQYAQRIQSSILPSNEYLESILPEYFVFFEPRDVVSGDFYWAFKTEANPIYEETETFEGRHKVLSGIEAEKIILTAVDCTGHGVPGAFMSMVGNDVLTDIVINRKITKADEILARLHLGVRFLLKQEETGNQDGMDMSLVVIDKEKQTLEFAGAKNPIVYIQNNELKVIKGDKMSIGGEQIEEERVFTKHYISLKEKTTFYLFSDGIQDQFGGAENKKFSPRRLRNLLFENHQKPMQEQAKILSDTIDLWQQEGNEDQIDDILVIGAKV